MHSIPIIGLGTYKFPKGSGDAERAVLSALDVGYRHIDTAFIYGGEQTEIQVGRALKRTTVPRNEIFLTTKQWRNYHGYDATKICLEKSLNKLQVEYIDLYLIHWPGPGHRSQMDEQDMVSLRAETWRAMEDAFYEGKVHAIGVSNFSIKHLDNLSKTARIWPPAINQIELHPYNPQSDLVDYCNKKGILIEAYASLGGQDVGKKAWKALGGPLLQNDKVIQVAKKHGRTPAQVLLRWATQQGFVVIPKSSSIKHLVENMEAVSTDTSLWINGGGLDGEDMELLAMLDQSATSLEKTRLCWTNDPLKMLDFD